MNDLEIMLTGLNSEHVVQWDERNRVHVEVMGPLKALQAKAQGAGFTMALASSFRDFSTQLRIWNGKAKGERAVLDSKSRPVDLSKLDNDEKVLAILRWSALPGASRHHWGTDFDVYDLSRMPAGYQLKLETEEFEGKGPFREFHDWLDAEMGAFGFFRPYATDRGGVHPERWHLSYAPLAKEFLELLTIDTVKSAITAADMEQQATILKLLPMLYDKFVVNIDPP